MTPPRKERGCKILRRHETIGETAMIIGTARMGRVAIAGQEFINTHCSGRVVAYVRKAVAERIERTETRGRNVSSGQP